MCGRLSLRYHRRRDGRHVMVGQTCPGRSPCASDGRETPAELLTSYDGCRPRWRRHDLPNCQTSASADQVHYIRSRHRLHRLDLIDRRTMAAGQESIDTVAGWCERQRMGPLFRCYTPDDLHGCGVEYVDYTGISNGHVQMLVLPIEEDDIGSPAQLLPAYDLSRCRFERDQCALITGAEQTMRGEIQIETMRTSRGNWKCACDGSGPLRIDGNNLGRIGDIHEKNLSIRIVDRPTALAGNSNLVLHDALVEIDHRQCVGAWQCGFTDVRDEDQPVAVRIGKPIRTFADRDLSQVWPGAWRKNADRVLGPVGGDDELCLVADNDAGNARQPRD